MWKSCSSVVASRIEPSNQAVVFLFDGNALFNAYWQRFPRSFLNRKLFQSCHFFSRGSTLFGLWLNMSSVAKLRELFLAKLNGSWGHSYTNQRCQDDERVFSLIYLNVYEIRDSSRNKSAATRNIVRREENISLLNLSKRNTEYNISLALNNVSDVGLYGPFQFVTACWTHESYCPQDVNHHHCS